MLRNKEKRRILQPPGRDGVATRRGASRSSTDGQIVNSCDCKVPAAIPGFVTESEQAGLCLRRNDGREEPKQETLRLILALVPAQKSRMNVQIRPNANHVFCACRAGEPTTTLTSGIPLPKA